MLMASMMGAIAFQKDLGAGALVRPCAIDRGRPAPRPRESGVMIESRDENSTGRREAKMAELARVADCLTLSEWRGTN
jgi:hypothetical protein